jgi:hypothetical protein
MLLLRTINDLASQSSLWIKSEVINDSSLQSIAEVEDKANTELDSKKTTEDSGRLTAIGLPTLESGELISCSVPYCGINGNYICSDITHTFDSSGFRTDVDIRSRETSTGVLFKERIDVENALSPYINLNAMEQSITLYFDGEQALTLSNCEESQSKISLISPATTGVMTSPMFTLNNNVNHCEFRVYANYPNTMNDVYEISNDGGLSWLVVTPGVVYDFLTPGKNIVIKITLNGNGTTLFPSYDACCLLLKE